MYSEKISAATLADLSRALKVREGKAHDHIELASAWQRLPADSPHRMHLAIGGAVVFLLVAVLLLQGLLAHQRLAFLLALLVVMAGAAIFWRMRHWFWVTVLEVSDADVALSFKGVWVPGRRTVKLESIAALIYRAPDGALSRLGILSDEGTIQLPCSGTSELDKLYCNVVRHLLQKRRPVIEFKRVD